MAESVVREENKVQEKTGKTGNPEAYSKYIKLAKTAGVIVIAAVVIEIFIFNFRSIQSLFYKETVLPVDGYMMTGMKYFGDGVYKLTREDVKGVAVVPEGKDQAELFHDTGEGVDSEGLAVNALYVTGLDETAGNIHSIRLDVETPDAIDLPMAESGILFVKIHIKDAGNAFYEETDWHPVIYANEASKYIYIQPAGKVSSLVFEFSLSNGTVLDVKSITLNAHRPVVFSFYRFLVILFVLTAAWSLRPGSVLWRENAVEKASWKGIVAATLCVLYIAPAWIMIQDNTYLASFVKFNPYQDLAHALSEGHFYLNEEPDPALSQLSNPYDETLRTAAGIDTKWDFAYYDGKYYVYFGIIPCLLFYLPFYLLFNINIPNAIPVVFAAIFLFAGTYELIKAMAARFCPNLKYAALLVLTTIVYFGSQLPFFLNQPDSYAVPVAWAEAMLVWGLFFWVSSLKHKGRKMYLLVAVGSFIMALIAGTRPNMEIYVLMALPLFFGFVRKCVADTKDGTVKVKFALSFIVPFIPAAVGLMYYNAARFGSVFDFGNNYNLTVSDVSLNPFSLDKVFIGIFEYLLKLPDLAYSFPYISIPGDGTETNAFGHCFVHMEYIFAGLLPVNIILFALPALFLKKKKESAEEKCGNDGRGSLRCFGITALAAALFLLLFDSVSAGIVYRYEADFSVALLIASAAAIMYVLNYIEGIEGDGGEILRRLVCVFIILALGWSLIYHFNFYFLTGLKYPLLWGNTELYYRVYYAFMFF